MSGVGSVAKLLLFAVWVSHQSGVQKTKKIIRRKFGCNTTTPKIDFYEPLASA